MIKDNQIPQNPGIAAEANQPSWFSMSVHTYIKMGIVGVLFFLFFYNELYYSMLHRWLNDPSWSHGFLIPLFSLYFLNQQKQEILSIKPKPNYLGLVVMLLTLAVYILNALQINFGILFSVLMLPMLIGIVLLLGGFQLIKYTWLPILYIGFAIPLPDRLYKAITMPMQIWASQIAAVLLSLIQDLEATSRGIIIDVVYKGKTLEPSLEVAETCGGMRLLMAFLALGVAMAYLHKRHWIQRLVLLASTIPIAILCNIVRVTITGFIYVIIAPKYAQGIYHDALGMAMLPLAFGFYGLLAWFMSNLFVDEKDSLLNEKEIIIARKGCSETDNVAKNE